MAVTPDANSSKSGETVPTGANNTGGAMKPSHTKNHTPTTDRNIGRIRNSANTRNTSGGNASSGLSVGLASVTP